MVNYKTILLTISSMNNKLLKELSNSFDKCVKGYHLINSEPIKGTVWESINMQIFNKSKFITFSKCEMGSHASGTDIVSSIGNFSNKSVKYKNSKQNNFSISSYHLTTLCDKSNPGNLENILTEINIKKNFDYYSIIARDDNKKTDIIHYDWLLLPGEHPILNPLSFIWTPKIGKFGKNINAQIGWHTNIVNGSSMSIRFSMASQLWLSIHFTDEMKKKYKIASIDIQKGPHTDYYSLCESIKELK